MEVERSEAAELDFTEFGARSGRATCGSRGRFSREAGRRPPRTATNPGIDRALSSLQDAADLGEEARKFCFGRGTLASTVLI